MTRNAAAVIAGLVVSAMGCGKPVPDSWNDLGLPLSGLKVAYGTTPSDTSLSLSAPSDEAPQTICERFKTVLETKGYTANPDALQRVTGANYNVTFTNAGRRVGVFCHRSDNLNLVDLSRTGR
jgi:hypothetical protein